ncbi:MAG: hypothetical protein OXT64_11785 [Gammaproteobacteria bacterium]|nr:hypothetical protein [Gammaproteobacteria bacterium]
MTNPDVPADRAALVARFFGAFRKRRLPPKPFIGGHEGSELASKLRGVTSREITYDRLDELGCLHLFPFLTIEGRLYFLPALMGLCVIDYDRSGGLPDAILGFFSPYPFPSPIRNWKRNLEAMRERSPVVADVAVDILVNSLVRPRRYYAARRETVQLMTRTERAAVVDFIDAMIGLDYDPEGLGPIRLAVDRRLSYSDPYISASREDRRALRGVVSFVVAEFGHCVSPADALKLVRLFDLSD